MRFKKLLACVLSAGMLCSSLPAAFAGAAERETLVFEAEETMTAVYGNMEPASPGNFGQSKGQANELCAKADGCPQIGDSSSTASTFVPLYYVFEIQVPEGGAYTMTAKYRGHETGRMVSFYIGGESGVGADPKALDVSGDTLAGQINASYFSGGNANHIETQNVSDTGRVGDTDAAANVFKLSAGKHYVKVLVTGVAPGTKSAQTRLNLDQFVLTPADDPDAPADYTAVDTAIAAAEAEDLTQYTDASVRILEDAIAAVVRDKTVAEQAAVDAMAKAIEDAIDGLIKKDAVPVAKQYLATACADPENSSQPFSTQGFSGAPDFSRFEGMDAGDYAQYVINVPAEGDYIFEIDYRAHESVGRAHFYLNGEKQKKDFTSPGSPNTRQTAVLGLMHLKQGRNTLQFQMYEKGSNGQSAKLNLFYFNITPYDPPEEPNPAPGQPVEYWAFDTCDETQSTENIFDEEFEAYPVSVVKATEPGQYASYTLDIKYPGEYKILAQYRAGENCGKAKAFVNGEEAEKLFDCSGMVEKSYYDNLGFHTLTEGKNTIKFEITGKDASRKGYNLVLYSFYIVPVGCQVDSGLEPFKKVSDGASTDKVDVYPMYAGGTLNVPSALYTNVTADGVKVPVIQYGQDEYDYGEFSMKKGPVEVEITFKDTITSYEISPKKLGIQGTVSGNKLRFTMEKDEYLIVKINSNNRRLILTADPAETDVPNTRGAGIFNVSAAPYSADGTGVHFATDAIQKAIDDAAAYGTKAKPGVVYVPAGVYQTGSLMLRSNVSLYLEGGAVLLGATRIQEWIPKGRKTSIGRGVTYLVFTDDGTVNTKVYGRGTVDGNAKTFKTMGGWKYAVEGLAPVNTSHFATDGIVYRGSGVWCVVPAFSNNLSFTNFKVFNNVGYGEDDGIDINGCQDVVVRNSISVNWDDPYSTKTERDGFEINAGWGSAEGKNTKNENILFDDCLAWTGCYGFKVGQGIGYDQHDITVQNSTVYDCAVGFGIHHKRFDGRIWNVTFDGIEVENITRDNDDHKSWFQCFIENSDGAAAEGDVIWNVAVKNINVLARSTTSPKMVSRKDSSMISGVSFENITMYGSTAPMSSMGQLGFASDINNPNLYGVPNGDGDKKASREVKLGHAHVYNADNYGVLGVQTSKIPGVYFNNRGSAVSTEKEASAYGGMVAKLSSGTNAFYNMVDFGSGVPSIDVRYASAAARGKVELRLDSADGTLIGTLDAGGSDILDYQTKTVAVTGATGIHDLYLVATDTVKLDYLDIGRVHHAVIGGQDTLKDVSFAGGADKVDVTAIARKAGKVELREGGADGALIGEVSFDAAEKGAAATGTIELRGALTGVKDIYIAASEGIDVEDISFIPAPAAELPCIVSAEAPDGVQVAYGTKPDELPLPATVKVTLSDGGAADAAVTWDTSSYVGDQPGTYELTGTIASSDAFTNADGVQVTIAVTVSEQAKPIVPGDLTGDGRVDISDVMAACRVLARISMNQQPTVDEVARGDLNGDHLITITDVMNICKILASKDQ